MFSVLTNVVNMSIIARPIYFRINASADKVAVRLGVLKCPRSLCGHCFGQKSVRIWMMMINHLRGGAKNKKMSSYGVL